MTLRYQSHLSLTEIGPAGQRRIESAKIALIGVGGIGGPAALYLTAAGVGELTLCDFDRVSETNLSRQVLFGPAELGRKKTDAAAEHLTRLNDGVKIRTLDQRVGVEQIKVLAGSTDLIIDASDNFATRLAVNQACVSNCHPWIMSAAIRFEGQLAVFRPDLDDKPCYRCLYQTAPDTLEDCAGAGVFSVAAGTLGLAAAGQAIAHVLGMSVSPGLHLFDAKTLEWQTLKAERDAQCDVCGLTRPCRAQPDSDPR